MSMMFWSPVSIRFSLPPSVAPISTALTCSTLGLATVSIGAGSLKCIPGPVVAT
jgi:hypothetical protein